MFPEDLLYTEDHEWIRDEGGEFTVGITAYAADQLGDVTYVELPEVGTDVHQGEAVAVVESVKAASDVYAPASGNVSEINERLETETELVNKDAYGEGWFYKLESAKAGDLKKLMNAKAYEKFVGEQEE
jgi:glycine cleavage system H protein